MTEIVRANMRSIISYLDRFEKPHDVQSHSIFLMLLHLLESPLAFVLFALVLGSACWITNKNVNEQDDVSAARLIALFFVTLGLTAVLTIVFGLFSGWILARVLATTLVGSGGAFVGLLLGIPLGLVGGAAAAVWASSRISRLLWRNE